MSQHSENDLSHVASIKTLITTFACLIGLTIVTVAATLVDFGSEINLVIALIIAGAKASLVALYFMHLRYDRTFHTLAFVLGLLAMILFIGLSFLDTGEYQADMLPPVP